MVRFHRFSLRSNPTETQIAIFAHPDRGKAHAPEARNRRKCWGNAGRRWLLIRRRARSDGQEPPVALWRDLVANPVWAERSVRWDWLLR